MTPVNRLENSWRIYSDIQNQIRYADRKVQILLAIGVAVLSFSLPEFQGVLNSPSVFIVLTAILSVSSGFSFFSFVLLALFARGTAVQSQSVIPVTFFGHIVHYDSAEEYAHVSSNATAEELLEDVDLQIYQISHIIMKKYLYYKKCWISLLTTMFFLLLLIICAKL